MSEKTRKRPQNRRRRGGAGGAGAGGAGAGGAGGDAGGGNAGRDKGRRGGTRARQDARGGAVGARSTSLGTGGEHASETSVGTAVFRPARQTRADDQSKYRRAFNKLMKDELAEMRNMRMAELFVAALTEYRDGQELLYRLDSNAEQGQRRIRDVLSRCEREEQCTLLVLPILSRLMKCEVECGKAAERSLLAVLEAVYRAPGIAALLMAFIVASHRTDEELSVVLWFLMKLGLAKDSALQPAHAQLAFERFHDSTCVEVRKYATVIGRFGSDRQDAASFSGGCMKGPGGRHDNDHADIRNILLMPTMNELACKEPPYLPTSKDVEQSQDLDLATISRQFRLLRADLVMSIHEELTSDKFKRRTLYEGTVDTLELLQGPSQPGMRVTFSWPKKHKLWRLINQERELEREHADTVKSESENLKKKFEANTKLGEGERKTQLREAMKQLKNSLDSTWNQKQEKCRRSRTELMDTQRRVFGHGSIVVVLRNDAVYTLGVVCQRDSKLLSLDPQKAVVHIAPLDGNWRELLSLSCNGPDGRTKLLSLRMALFSYKPILRSLQAMVNVPMCEEILHGEAQEIEPRGNLLRAIDRNPDLKPVLVNLDERQREAFNAALFQRVSLIQGPPGTGKTYLGSAIIRALHSDVHEKILVVCCTNHALDALLEQLLDFGMTDILRLGGGCKNPRILEYTLRAQSDGNPEMPRSSRKRLRELTRFLPDMEAHIRHLYEKLEQSSIRSISFRDLQDEIDLDGTDADRRIADSLVMEMPPDYDDSFTLVGEGGQVVDENYLWDRWRKGASVDPRRKLGLVSSSTTDDTTDDIWKMPLEERKSQIASWEERFIRANIIADIERQLVDYELITDEIHQIRTLCRLAHLRDQRLIGCTTTGASMYSDILADLKPTTVMVEEAAEILECHVITTIRDSCTRLVMIGDHLQLRPKVSQHSLTVASGRGHDLDLSLFERLAKGSYPVVTLATQHRMRPELSRIIRAVTYPSLMDAPKVHEHPQEIRGLQSNVVFVNHSHPETGSGSDDAESLSTSKCNPFEAEMAAAVLQHLFHHGYRADQVVILTPYLGQLRAIQEHVERVVKECLTELNEADRAELVRQGLIADDDDGSRRAKSRGRSSGQQLKRVRVATIDNFQGEESDIVIASLVRSNARGDIGFLWEAERVNVLFSRARFGFVCIGDMGTLVQARRPRGRQLWTRMNQLLSASIQDGVPLHCPRHDTKILVHNVKEFTEKSPNGGCDLPCGEMLPCHHACPLPCHDPSLHSTITCIEMIQGTCDVGHFMEWPCGNKSRACQVCQKLRNIEKEAKRKEAAALKQLGETMNKLSLERHEAERKLAASLEAKNRERQLREARLQRKLAEIEASKAKRIADEYANSPDASLDAIEKEARERADAAVRDARQEAMAAAVHDKSDTALPPPSLETPEVKTLKAKYVAQQKKVAELDIEKQFKRELAELSGLDEESRGERWMDQLHLRMLDKPVDADVVVKKLRTLSSERPGVIERVRTIMCSIFGDAVGQMLISVVNGDAAAAAICADHQSVLRSLSEGQLIRAHTHLEKRKCKSSSLFTFVQFKLDDMDATKAWRQVGTEIREDHRNPPVPEDEHQEDRQETTTQQVSNTHTAPADAYALASIAFAFIHDKLRQNDVRGIDTRAWATVCGYSLALLTLSTSSQAHPYFRASSTKSELRDMFQFTCRAALCGPTASNVEAQRPDADGPDAKQELVKKQWNSRKARGFKSTAMDELMSLTGLVSVKESFLTVYCAVDAAQKRGDSTGIRLHCLFQGNPGTGKTTVARLYARFLHECGALPSACFVETSGAKLVDMRVDGLKKILAKIEQARGGVLFVDEAYQLDPQRDPSGRQILNYFLDEMENKCKTLVVLFAGYKADIEKLIEANQGLPSRFPFTFTFADYTEKELHSILKFEIKKRGKQSKRPFRIEGGVDGKPMRIAVRRIAAMSGRQGFGNARTVQLFFDRVLGRKAIDPCSTDPFYISRNDLLGKQTVVGARSSKAYLQLQSLTGLAEVKRAVEEFIDVVSTNAAREELEQPPLPVVLNRLFLGNPGTGKTTVAKLYGTLLRDLGFLSKGDVVEKVASDFIGGVLGESEEKTKSILEAAAGCVLLIDEAYGLNPKSGFLSGGDKYREGVINTIVERVQNTPGDDRCVIMMGYSDEMEELMRIANPGLKRRFALENAFYFQDFTDDELLQILSRKLKDKGLCASLEAKKVAITKLGQQRRMPNFGNAGAVNNLISSAVLRQEGRLREERSTPVERAQAPLVALDFDPEHKEAGNIDFEDVVSMVDEMVGAPEVKDFVLTLCASVQMARARGDDIMSALPPLNFRFIGSPGTGKTTVARQFGKILHKLGVLGSDEVLEVSASDFIPGYIGQTAGKTKEIFDRARGRVLFIDEAYALSPVRGGQYAGEALDEMTKLLTDTKYHGNMVVILAGYPDEIEDLMASNTGLTSRIPNVIPFHDMTPEVANELFIQLLRKEQLSFASPDLHTAALDEFKRIVELEAWSNGRDVHTLAKFVKQQVANRLFSGCNSSATHEITEDALNEVLEIDITEAFSKLRTGREPRADRRREKATTSKEAIPRLQQATQSASSLPKATKSMTKACQESESTVDEEDGLDLDQNDSDHAVVERDASVSEKVWRRLQNDKEHQDRRKRDDDMRIRLLEEDRLRIEAEQRKLEEILRLARERALREQDERIKRELADRQRERELELERLQEEKLRKEDELRRLREKEQQEKQVQQKLRDMGVCPANFRWIKQTNGYRCAGGSHFISAKNLGL